MAASYFRPGGLRKRNKNREVRRLRLFHGMAAIAKKRAASYNMSIQWIALFS
jgi:hypothetical protein